MLLTISVVPIYFYSTRLEAINRDRLKTNEMLLQNTVTRSLAEDIAQRNNSMHMMLSNLSYAVQVTSGGDISAQSVERPELRALLENFVSSADDLAYATLLNSEAKGISAGRILPDAFLQRELERAFTAARENRAYTGQALTLGSGREARTVILVSTPVIASGRFLGMIACVEDLNFLMRRLRDSSNGGLMTYVVDGQGRLVAASTSDFATGQDMTGMEIVRNFVAAGGKAQLVETKEFTVKSGKNNVETLGTYSPVSSLDWAVIGQKPQREAYRGVYDMQRAARFFAILAVLLSIGVSIFAARRISSPLRTLAETSRAIARGDFSQRIHINSHTEIGELAQTFNVMSDELEHFVQDLRHAADENRDLFLNSIQMLAGAVDEKDPYTRGHSDRVTRYSVMIARELGLPETYVETVRISAQLHDVGKIGIEDRILKKPGTLTAEEFEIMKTHTTKGANILRGVPQLAEMLPGIELHHESLDGRGYPRGLKGDEIPLLPRIIAVADTFDAVTTNRPYQQAHEPVDALQILHKLAGKRLDPKAVEAFTAVFERGEIRVPRKVTVATPVASPSPVTAVISAPDADNIAAAVEASRI